MCMSKLEQQPRRLKSYAQLTDEYAAAIQRKMDAVQCLLDSIGAMIKTAKTPADRLAILEMQDQVDDQLTRLGRAMRAVPVDHDRWLEAAGQDTFYEVFNRDALLQAEEDSSP